MSTPVPITIPSSASLKAAEKWALIKSQGAKWSAQSSRATSLPAFANHELITKYQQYSQQCIMSFVIGAASGLWFLLHTPEIFVPLLATKRSESMSCLFLRYNSTVKITLDWLQSDMRDVKSEGRVWLEKVRSMHNHVCKLMHKMAEGHEHLTPKEGTVWVSQKDMVVTQFAFVGLTLLFPEACGFNLKSHEEHVEATVHFWLVLGSLLGIPREFNLCSGTRDETMELCRIIMREEFLPVLEGTVQAEEKIVKMSQDMAADAASVLRCIAPMLSGRILHEYWARVAGSNKKADLMTAERFRLFCIRTFIQKLLPFGWIRKMATYLWFANYRTVWGKRDARAEKIRAKNPEIRYKLSDLQSSRCLQ